MNDTANKSVRKGISYQQLVHTSDKITYVMIINFKKGESIE